MMQTTNARELTAKEKRAIRKLVTASCANYDKGYGCLPLDGGCYMLTIGYRSSSLCRYFRDAVLPTEPGLEALFKGDAVKRCKRCGRNFPVNGRQAYCSAVCAQMTRRAATAVRVRRHRKKVTREM